MEKKLLIIGRKGFLGSNLIRFLKKNMNLTTSNFENFISDNQIYNKKYDYIINCSSNKSFLNKKHSLKNDNDFIIANKIAHSETKLIMFSTRKIYKPKYDIKETDLKKPICNYSKNKLISENLVKKTLKNRSLIFICDAEKLNLEKSIFLGKNQILNNNCITISGYINSNIKEVNWKIVKNI